MFVRSCSGGFVYAGVSFIVGYLAFSLWYIQNVLTSLLCCKWSSLLTGYSSIQRVSSLSLSSQCAILKCICLCWDPLQAPQGKHPPWFSGLHSNWEQRFRQCWHDGLLVCFLGVCLNIYKVSIMNFPLCQPTHTFLLIQIIDTPFISFTSTRSNRQPKRPTIETSVRWLHRAIFVGLHRFCLENAAMNVLGFMVNTTEGGTQKVSIICTECFLGGAFCRLLYFVFQ